MATTLQYIRGGAIATGVYNPVWFSGVNTAKAGHRYTYSLEYELNDATSGTITGEVVQSANTYGLLEVGVLLNSISSYHKDLTPSNQVISLPKQGGKFSLSVGEKYIWSDASSGYGNSSGNVQLTLTGAISLTGQWLIITDSTNFAQPLIAQVLSSSGANVVIDYPYADLTSTVSAWSVTTTSNLEVTVTEDELVTDKSFIKGGDVLSSDTNNGAWIQAISAGTDIQGYGTTTLIKLPCNEQSLFAFNVQEDPEDISVTRDGVSGTTLTINNNAQIVVRANILQHTTVSIVNSLNDNSLNFSFEEVQGCEWDNIIFFDRGGNVLSIPCRVKDTKISNPTKTKYTNDYRPFSWSTNTTEVNQLTGNTRSTAITQNGSIVLDLCTLTSEQAELLLHELVNSPLVYYKKGAALAHACELLTATAETNRRNYLTNATVEIKLNQTRSSC